jgi:hypothetical protein
MLGEKKLQQIFGSFLDQVKLLVWEKLFWKNSTHSQQISIIFLTSFLNMLINIHNTEES